METLAQKKRPTGMTILLVLSFINACWNILRSTVLYFTTPKMVEMYENGQFDEMMAPFSGMGAEFTNAMNDAMHVFSQINPTYYLILLALFIASLVGVIRMFKVDKRGLHIYAIAQICMLIDHSIFVYPLQKPNSFTPDLIITILFILLYYLYFKRMEISPRSENDEQL